MSDMGGLRILDHLKKAWRGIAGAGGEIGDLELKPDLPPSQSDRLREQMRACLAGVGGEVSARRRAAQLGRAYLALDKTGRQRFLSILAKDFAPNREKIDNAAKVLLDVSDADKAGAQKVLREALESPRSKLLTQFNGLPEGVKFLVDMRAEILSLLKSNPELQPLEDDLKALLMSWFDVGFLEMKRIRWDAPAELLEKLIAYEAVHAIKSWDDLKNRLDSDRRCFAFFHPRMPNEPLIFVEVALVAGMSGNIHTLLDENAPVLDPSQADTAIFYSISNAQKGLAGISFGNFLIKRVVDRLMRDFPNLKDFATLSPVPGFRRWLNQKISEGEPKLILTKERDVLKRLNISPGTKGSLKAVLEKENWHLDRQVTEALRPLFMRLCARYLNQEKREGNKAIDPVAHFHLTNGARMERLNWLADVSDNGINQSVGIMVNYRYKLREIDANHEAYSSTGEARMSSEFKALLKG